MTFTDLQTEIMDRLNLSSATAATRIGRAINRKYRLVTSSIGLQLSRRATVQQAVSIGVSQVTFTNVEKIINVVDRSVSPYRKLSFVTIDELRDTQPYPLSDGPTVYADEAISAESVTIEINRIPQTAFVLYADVHQTLADLSGTATPAFPESFHDVIIEGVMADELRKMEKGQLATMAKGEYERILSDLRMWIAKSGLLDIHPAKLSGIRNSSSGSGGSGGSTSGALSYTQSGLITFTRNPLAPFAVSPSSAKVTNLDSDKLDGLDSTAFAQKSLNETIVGNWTFSGANSVTGLVTFSRNPSAPFAVAAGSANVPNLDADKLDGLDSLAFAQTGLTNAWTATQSFLVGVSGGLPGVGFAGDTNTGVAQNGADTLELLTGGTTGLRVDSTRFIDSPTQPRCLAFKTGTQSLTNATETPIALDTEDYDISSLHDTVTNNSRMTIPTGADGTYLIQGNYNPNAAAGDAYCYLKKNGTTQLRGTMSRFLLNASFTTTGKSLAIVALVATDFIELIGYQNSGGSLTTGDAGSQFFQNSLHIVKLW